MTPTLLTVAVEQGTATFECQHLTCDDISWQVNETSLDNVKSQNITTDRILLPSAEFRHSLTIDTLLEYNQTIVECVAVFFKRTSVLTEPVVLLIQGLTVEQCTTCTCALSMLVFLRHSWKCE